MKVLKYCRVSKSWFALILIIPLLSTARLSVAQTLLEARDPVPIRFQLRWHHQFQFAGYYAAKEKGFYEKAGFDVELIAGSPDKQPVSEVLTGRAQYAQGNSEVLYSRLKGEPLVVLATIFQQSPSVILTLKSSGIEHPVDLIGRRLMGVQGVSDVDFRAMLASENVNLNSIDFIDSSYQIEDLIDKKTDAFNAYLTNEPFYLEERGVSFNVINPADYGVNFYSDMLFTSEQEVRLHPGRAERFKQATIDGWKYALANPEEIIQLIREKYNDQKTLNHMRFEALSVISLIMPELIEIGYINTSRFESMAKTFLEHGLVTGIEHYDGFIFSPKDKDNQWILNFLMVVGVILVAVILIFGLAAYSNTRQQSKIDERREEEEKLGLLTNKDPLTQLLNRRAFESKYYEELIRAQRYGDVFSILIVDIDEIKTLDELHGENTKEATIIALAKLLMNDSRDSDFLGRYTGEEFVLLLPKTTITEAENYSMRLCHFIEDNPVSIAGPQTLGSEALGVKPLSLTLSIGVAQWKPEDNEEDTLINAEKALFKAKTNGKNQVAVWDGLDIRLT